MAQIKSISLYRKKSTTGPKLMVAIEYFISHAHREKWFCAQSIKNGNNLSSVYLLWNVLIIIILKYLIGFYMTCKVYFPNWNSIRKLYLLQLICFLHCICACVVIYFTCADRTKVYNQRTKIAWHLYRAKRLYRIEIGDLWSSLENIKLTNLVQCLIER